MMPGLRSIQFEATMRTAERPSNCPGPRIYPPPSTPLVDPEIIAAFKATFNDAYIPDNGPSDAVGLTYSFHHKNALFIGIDEYINPHKVNQTWLSSQLSNHNITQVFVFGHEPAWKLAHNDSLAYYPEDRDLFWNSLGGAGGRMYFCGHDHLYDRSHAYDASGHQIYQVIVGSCGAPQLPAVPPYPESPRVTGDCRDLKHSGYMLVTVYGNHARADWRALDNGSWKVLDTFEYNLSGPFGDQVAGADKVLGMVKDGQFTVLSPKTDKGKIVKVTVDSMAVDRPIQEKDLKEYEGRAIMVQGDYRGDTIYLAQIIDEAGPISTALVREVYG
jgi:hypothetical protein